MILRLLYFNYDDYKLFITVTSSIYNVTPAQAGGKRQKGDSGPEY